jgi:hypothetical protein
MKEQEIKKFNPFIIFFKYFIIVGALANLLNLYFGFGLATLHFVFSFLIFIDEDFEDPHTPNEIDDIGKPLNYTLYAN